MTLQQALGAPRLHHVGIVTDDLDAAVDRYRRLGFGEPHLFDVLEQGVRIASFAAGPGYVEVLTPIDPTTGVARYLASRGPGVHHVAFAVPDVATGLRQAEAAGFELIDREPRRGIHGWRVGFLHPRSCGGVLVELVQPEG